MRECKPLPYGQLTTALVPTVPSSCFLRLSATVAKVIETFLCLVRPYPLRDRRVFGGRRSGRPWLGPGLVCVVCASLSFLDRSLQSPGQEKHFGILFKPPAS